MDEINKWKMNRAGLLNFWYYDEEYFDFSQGKLLLRGSNGSGKSVTMQSFLPVLLDGKKSPDRLDPFGSNARRMEDYLLGEKDVVDRDERTGYLFIEYKKENSSQYVTTGIGLQAKRHKDMKFWGFVITDNRRIGHDFQLYQMQQGDKIPLSHKELENRVGDGGEVVRGQKEYMNLVNKHVFGFQSLDDFEELIKLLIQLRSPKLSKDFRPTVIYEILESALPPLADDDLRHLSDTIENMDQTRQQLEQLEREHKSTKKLTTVYDRYNRFLLAEKAVAVMKAEKLYHEVKANCEEEKEKAGLLEKEVYLLKQQKADLTQRKEVAEGEKDRLVRHEVWNIQKELSKTVDRVSEIKKDLDRKRIQLDQKRKQSFEYRDQLLKTEDELNQKERVIQEYLDELLLDSGESAFHGHEMNVQDFLRSKKADFDFTVWKKEAAHHYAVLEEIKEDFKEQQRYKEDMEQKYRESSELKQESDTLRHEKSDLESLFDQDLQNIEAAIYSWLEQHSVLEVSRSATQDMARSLSYLYESVTYEEIKAPFYEAVQHYQKQLLSKSAELESILIEKTKKKEQYEKEKLAWQTSTDPEPERFEATNQYRQALYEAGVPHVPFYAAVEFQDHVTEVQKERIESSLKKMGILDSLITDNLDHIRNDSYIRPNPVVMGHTLADYLKPDLDKQHPISNNIVQEVLMTISAGEDLALHTGGESVITESGLYQMSCVIGHAPSEESSRFIGRSSRKRYRQEKIEELEKHLYNVSIEIMELRASKSSLDEQQSETKRWMASFPSDRDLQEIHYQLRKLDFQLDEKIKQLNRIDSQYKEVALYFQAIKQRILDKTRSLELESNLTAYKSALEYMKHYQDYLFKLDKEHTSLQYLYKEQRTTQNRINEFEEELIELSGQCNILDNSLSAIMAEVESIQKQLKLQGIDEVILRIQEIQEELSIVAESLEIVNRDLPTKEQILIQSHSSLSEKERTLTFQSRLLDSWNKALEDELSLYFVVLEDPIPATIIQECGDELERDRSKMNELLSKTYFNEQPNLMEYRLIEYDERMETPEWFTGHEWKDTEDLYLREWRQLNQRKKVLLEYRGQKVSPYIVLQSLEQELERQQNWLDEQDRQLYEDIILKSVGVILRSKIQKAEKWIKQMNVLMENRNSSSGLTFSIAWKAQTAESEEELDTKELVQLLQRNSKFLNEEDLNKITLHFQSKIKRAKELIELRNEGNTLHQVLKEVLDYRKWFSFVLSFKREREPKRELTNNAFFKFSGGEKAMAMYIPLFTAAYSRYQEASPNAPYIISLDEAFAGVDENNIRDMFEVVEELGFNYIMNSQALWGDYDTISSLSICELVRPKNADCVSVIRYKWDGEKKYLDIDDAILQE
ncbi:TIGR02680 family protein [Peribacillus sp. SCS-26]|uniref:TIGR02680 family protein n=1 Tax=Paraperibacillus marinus TaxID=3115295 RepID=UPI003906D366